MQNSKYPRAEKLKKNTEISLLFEKGKWRNQWKSESHYSERQTWHFCGNLKIWSFCFEKIF